MITKAALQRGDLYDEAADLYEEKRYSEAIELLGFGIIRWPTDNELLLLLAGCFLELHKFTEASRILLRAEKIAPEDPLIAYNLGYALFCMGRVSDGEEHVRKALGLNPPGKVRKMAQRMLDSVQEFRKTNNTDSRISLEEEFLCQDLFLKAQEHLYANDHKKAMSLYRKVLKKKPEHASSVMNLGLCHVRLGEFAKGLPYLKKAHELEPSDPLALANIALACHYQGEAEVSERYVADLMERTRKFTLRNLVRVATVLVQLGKYDAAQQILEKNPYTNDQWAFHLGVVNALKKDYAKAMERFKPLRQRWKRAGLYYRKAEDLSRGKIRSFRFEPTILETTVELL